RRPMRCTARSRASCAISMRDPRAVCPAHPGGSERAASRELEPRPGIRVPRLDAHARSRCSRPAARRVGERSASSLEIVFGAVQSYPLQGSESGIGAPSMIGACVDTASARNLFRTSLQLSFLIGWVQASDSSSMHNDVSAYPSQNFLIFDLQSALDV